MGNSELNEYQSIHINSLQHWIHHLRHNVVENHWPPEIMEISQWSTDSDLLNSWFNKTEVLLHSTGISASIHSLQNVYQNSIDWRSQYNSSTSFYVEVCTQKEGKGRQVIQVRLEMAS